MDGLQGNMMAQPRMFGHDAITLTADATGNSRIPNTEDRGVVIYNGKSSAQNIKIVAESGEEIEFKSVQPGTVVGNTTPMLAIKLLVGTECVAIY
jgi:uncharacterized protein YbcV (DUF1398 family)